MMLSIRMLLATFVITSAAATTGCGSLVDDRINTICGCEDCGERELQEVEIIVEADYDVASAYDCIELIEPYWECQLQRHECDDRKYKDDDKECKDELREYDECLQAKSSRDPGPY